MRTRSYSVFLLALCSLALCLSGFPTQPPIAAAQPLDPPLFLLMDGDLWAYNEASTTLTQLTRWGYNQTPVVSPDGRRVAYASTAEIAIEALRRYGETPNIPPANIWIWDVASGTATRIAQQPANASFGMGYQTETFVRRSTPAWSPDGTMLAWVEETVTQTTTGGQASLQAVPQLTIYDFRVNAARAVVPIDNRSMPVGIPQWGKSGIALRLPQTGASDTPGDRFIAYNDAGLKTFDLVLPPVTGSFILDYGWVNQIGQEYLGAAYQNGSWTLINPANATTLKATGVPELYSLRAPSGVSARWSPRSMGFSWIATGNGQDVALSTFSGVPSQFALAPSGQALAYIADAVYLLRGGKTIRIPGTERVATNRLAYLTWGAMGYRATTYPIAQPPPIQATLTPFTGACAGAPPARLTVGMVGRVIVDPQNRPNALNSQPSPPSRDPNSVRLGSIPAGGVFTVRNGPICKAGYLWWLVSYNDQLGWTAEGEGTTYWLEPHTGAPPSACAPNLPPRLQIGGRARVTPGVANAVRTAPSTQETISQVAGAIPGGAIFNVLNGPLCGDGYTWWQVEYLGVRGWTPEGEGFTYWVEPLYCGFDLPSRLVIGQQARVTPGLPNALRTQPSTDEAISAVLAPIPGGGVFTVLAGPRCGDGLVWWQVNYNGLLGWTPEGEKSTYWLEPVN
ncbi:MAG: PD40 domain-containing protein [Anaerolineales bacterium]|nr:PD40 domain-containing protein [Anaerolineales bacterium]